MMARPRRLARLRPQTSSRAVRWLSVALIGIVLGAAVLAPWLAPFNPFSLAGPPLDPPSGTHLMGTDALGRDLFSAVVHGARTSVLVSLGSAIPAAIIGTSVGLIAGYVGGFMDNALMRVTEFVQIIPRFFLAIVVLAIFGNGYRNLVIVLALSSWPVIGRTVRAAVFSLREQPYIAAAQVVGARTFQILLKEIVPALWETVAVLTGLLIADVILIEASLSFLGLGDPNRPSWGRLAAEAQQYLRVAWWLPLFPGIAIVIAVLGVNLALDSRRRPTATAL